MTICTKINTTKSRWNNIKKKRFPTLSELVDLAAIFSASWQVNYADN